MFGAMVSYIRDVLDVFGIDLLHSKVRAQGYLFNFLRFLTGNRTVFVGSSQKYQNGYQK